LFHYPDSDKAHEPIPVCNFIPKIEYAADRFLSDTESDSTVHVTIKLNFGDDKFSREFTVPAPDLEEANWLRLDSRCAYHPDINPAKARRIIAFEVRNALQDTQFKKQYVLDKLGTQTINGQVVFCTGGGVIMPLAGIGNNAEVVVENTPHNLDVDTSMLEIDSITEMMELLGLVPNAGQILFAHSALYAMRKAYEVAWKSPCCSIFIYGASGTMKTTFSAFLTQIYDRKKGILSPPRLNASIAGAVKILYEKNDTVVVLDDLFPASDKATKRSQEETLIEITRIVGDGIEPVRMRGHKVAKAPPTCGVVFTGEYLIGTGSDAARLLPVEMTSPNGTLLKRFQDNPLMVSTFYRNFIRWFIDNYDEIVKYIRQWRDAYQNTNLGVHERLKETHFFLNSAYALLLQYCSDKKALSASDTETLHNAFLGLLNDLVNVQNQRVQQGIPSAHMLEEDYLGTVRTAFNEGEIIIISEPKRFVDEIHDGVFNRNCLAIRGKALLRLFPGTPIEDIASGLEQQGALQRRGGKRAVQIHGTNGKRFYAIPLKCI
jgi:hypothetical protein